MPPTKVIAFHIPDDPALLAAFGEVALRHEHMSHILRMTMKSLAGITPLAATAATMYEGSRQLRDRAKTLARKRLGEGAPLMKLQALINACGALSDERNDLVHGLWAKELDGEAHIRNAFGKVRPLPTAQQLKDLANRIESLTSSLNHERLKGFLAEALVKRLDA